jgi:glycosyltransferase involved in cell wall biosynthesis
MKLAIAGSRGFPSTYGGYETLVRHLAPYLVSQGHDVTVYCRARDESRRAWITEGVRCIATHGRDTKSLSTLSFGATSFADASVRRFDAVLVLNIANGFWLPLLKGSRTPCAVNTDGLEWERGKWSTLGKNVFRWGASLTARFADELVCDSVEMGRIWQERYARDSTFIPYGAPVLSGLGSDKLVPLGLPQKPFALVVARLVPENNVELTLDAIAALGDDAPHLVVVGSANGESPIEHELERRQAGGQVTWLGHVDDQQLLMQLWANCAVYVHGHSVGGTNPALLQALGAGAPTLALDTPFNAEVLPEADQRYPDDASALAERIRQVTTSTDVQDEYRDRGRKHVAERYSWDAVCASYADVLTNLALQRPRRRSSR